MVVYSLYRGNAIYIDLFKDIECFVTNLTLFYRTHYATLEPLFTAYIEPNNQLCALIDLYIVYIYIYDTIW